VLICCTCYDFCCRAPQLSVMRQKTLEFHALDDAFSNVPEPYCMVAYHCCLLGKVIPWLQVLCEHIMNTFRAKRSCIFTHVECEERLAKSFRINEPAHFLEHCLCLWHMSYIRKAEFEHACICRLMHSCCCQLLLACATCNSKCGFSYCYCMPGGSFASKAIVSQ